MISLLRNLGMPDDPLPDSNKTIVVFLETIAFALGWNGIDRLLVSGTRLVAIPILIASACISYAGIKWPRIKRAIGPRSASVLKQITGRPLYRVLVYSVMVIALSVSIGFTAYRHWRAKPSRTASTSTNPPNASISSSSLDSSDSNASLSLDDDDSQYKLFHLSPKTKAQLDRIKDSLFKYKAAVLDTSLYHKREATRDELRKTVEDTERKYGCLIDMATVQCLPRPPAAIDDNEVDIDISTKMVADELSKTMFWVIHDKNTKVRVPIVMFVSLVNRRATPLKISLLYLDAKSVDGWADVRMTDSLLFPYGQTMDERPLVLQGKNACASMKGEYLLPSLYDRIIQPGDKVEGWLIAEYPKGFKYGSSIGDMRISLRAGDRWIASKTFPANPRVYDNSRAFDWYTVPMDTLITEDW